LAPASVTFGDPGREASARRRQPLGELRVECADFLTKLEEAKVEQSLRVAHVGARGCALDRRPALGAGHVARLRERPEHGDFLDVRNHHWLLSATPHPPFEGVAGDDDPLSVPHVVRAGSVSGTAPSCCIIASVSQMIHASRALPSAMRE
jgi:hypothetical protein